MGIIEHCEVILAFNDGEGEGRLGARLGGGFLLELFGGGDLRTSLSGYFRRFIGIIHHRSLITNHLLFMNKKIGSTIENG